MTDPNDAAYPIVEGDVMTDYGLTKRELFAAMALQGLLTNDRLHGDQSTFAIQSVALADALIEALNIGALNKATEQP